MIITFLPINQKPFAEKKQKRAFWNAIPVAQNLYIYDDEKQKRKKKSEKN